MLEHAIEHNQMTALNVVLARRPPASTGRESPPTRQPLHSKRYSTQLSCVTRHLGKHVNSSLFYLLLGLLNWRVITQRGPCLIHGDRSTFTEAQVTLIQAKVLGGLAFECKSP
jgi:hypothetical protein